MKKLLSTHLPTACSLAGIAREIFFETRNAATHKVSDLRAQVDELWKAADDLLPRDQATAAARHVGKVVSKLRHHHTIVFPKGLKA